MRESNHAIDDRQADHCAEPTVGSLAAERRKWIRRLSATALVGIGLGAAAASLDVLSLSGVLVRHPILEALTVASLIVLLAVGMFAVHCLDRIEIIKANLNEHRRRDPAPAKRSNENPAIHYRGTDNVRGGGFVRSANGL